MAHATVDLPISRLQIALNVGFLLCKYCLQTTVPENGLSAVASAIAIKHMLAYFVSAASCWRYTESGTRVTYK